MAFYLLQGIPIRQLDTAGVTVSGALLHTYAAGTSTPHDTYTDSTGGTTHSNPIVADAAGHFPEIWVDTDSLKLECRKTDDVTVLWQADNVRSAEGVSASAISALYGRLASSVIAGDGAGMLGYGVGLSYAQGTVGAALRNWRTLQDYGAVCDGSTDDTASVVDAIASGFPIKVVGRAKIDGDLVLPSGVSFFSDDSKNNGFVLNPQSALITGGVHGWFKLDTAANVDGVTFDGIGFWGQYDAGYAGSTVFSIIKIAPQSGVVHRNIVVNKCRFFDPVQNCIGISPNSGGTVTGVWVDQCVADVSVSLANSSRAANLVQTILEYIDWPDHATSYGTITCTTNIFVTNCVARGIRTLADIKRGTRRFVLSNLQTVDMSDCHNSIDGSFAGVVTGLIAKQTTNLLPNKNALEVQGEDISISRVNVDFDTSFGSNAGILVTGYAFPVEGVGASHQSRNIRIDDAIFYGIDQTCIRLLDVDSPRVSNVYARQMTGSVVSIEHTYTGLVPTRATIDDISAPSGTGSGYVVDIAGTAIKTRIGRISTRSARTSTANYKAFYRDGTEYIGDRSMLLIGGVLPGFTASASAISNVADGPPDRGNCVEVNDASAVALGCLLMNGGVPCGQFETVSVRVWAKLGTAAACGLRFQEYNGGVLLSNSYMALSATGWTENVKHYTASNAACSHVVVSFMAATATGDVTATGTSRFIIDGIAEGTV